MNETIRFSERQLPLAWDIFYIEVSKRPKYISLIKFQDQYLICYRVPIRFKDKILLKIHGEI